MKTLRNWHDLSEFGIHCLTGEACGIGMRLLCDLTHGGAKLVREFLGLPYDCPLMENWNSGAVASMMLSHGAFVDLAAFCLLSAGKCKMAFHIKNEGVWGAESDEEIAETRENSGTAYQITRQYSLRGDAANGTRCIHQMSGRVA